MQSGEERRDKAGAGGCRRWEMRAREEGKEDTIPVYGSLLAAISGYALAPIRPFDPSTSEPPQPPPRLTLSPPVCSSPSYVSLVFYLRSSTRLLLFALHLLCHRVPTLSRNTACYQHRRLQDRSVSHYSRYTGPRRAVWIFAAI